MRVVVTGLSHSYRHRRVLEGVDLECGPGAMGLLGPNGAGKTTLLRLLAGVLRAKSGWIQAGRHDLRTRAGRRALRRGLGYLPQDVALPPDMSTRDFLDYVGLLKGMADPHERRRQTAEMVEHLGLDLVSDRRLGTLSAGTRRRVGVAQAFMGDPGLVLLDEPTSGLDPEERIRLRSVLGMLGGDRTVILCTHLLEDVTAVCPELAVLHAGRVAYSGSTSGLREIATDRTFELPRPPAGEGFGDLGPPRRERLLTDFPPPGARPVTPSAEEGYAALMHDLRGEPVAW
ncbi:ATP-binding cassette domain-containing protein [Nocardiopsis kunsanensis]|uniref:ATP-binding cassette domain-containing protein n=1 Tax=Nocardiopsis kunsanensis TaxID=141693 RepID=UPI00034BBE46|nr:ATP-binding cassette domain-containing protein [Nocardiopsis kunsanensis]